MSLKEHDLSHQFETQPDLTWEERGIGSTTAAQINRYPTMVEYFLGIRMEMLDPVLRDAIVIFAEKGYVPYDSCQGHSPEVESHISFSYALPREAITYFTSLAEQGIRLGKDITFEDITCISEITLDKRAVPRSPQQTKEFFIQVADNAPKLGELVFLSDESHNKLFIHVVGLRYEYPDLYDVKTLPPERIYSTDTAIRMSRQNGVR